MGYAQFILYILASGAIFLDEAVVSEITQRFFFSQKRSRRLPWGSPSLDVFAGPLPGEHVTSQYYTKHWCPGSMGADAFLYSWDVCHPGTGYQMAWIYPPAELITRTLQRLQDQPIHATLILPDKVALWTPLLHSLPIVARHIIAPGRIHLGAGAPPEWETAKPGRLLAFRVWQGL